jgi:6-phosphofructokinase
VPIVEVLRSVTALSSLSDQDLDTLAAVLEPLQVQGGEVVFKTGDPGDGAYFLSAGSCRLLVYDRLVRAYSAGSLFGELSLMDDRPRTGTLVAETACTLHRLSRAALDQLPAALLARFYRALGGMLSGYLRDSEPFFKSMEVLLIQDGGCAPGYNPVTAFLSEYLEKAGHAVFVTAEGFRSLIGNQPQDFRALVYDKTLFDQLDHIPGVIFSPPLREARGADFRSERFPQFKEAALQQRALQTLQDRRVRVVVGIGGNGTFKGIHALAKLTDDIRFFFVPVTIDSDVSGTECIGEYTGVEVGAEKIRCYMADARSHKRMYIVELMGAQGGYHALHSCLGAGAHLAVLPGHAQDLPALVQALADRDHTVIVVAEGYQRDLRRQQQYPGNAAEFFRDELLQAGLKTRQKIVCESFSRDIRGAGANNMDLMLSQRMARKVSQLLADGRTDVMPSVNSSQEGAIPFSEVRTNNSVLPGLASLANRLY